MQLTSIEYFIEEMEKHIDTSNLPIGVIIKAHEMHKQEIILAWENGALPRIFKEYNCSRDYFKATYNN